MRSILQCLLASATISAAAPVASNLAPAGVPTGSSVYTGAPPSQFTDASDGNRDGNYFGELSVFHSAGAETNPPTFWEIDLGSNFRLDRVMIWPRTDAAQSTVENFKLVVRDDANAIVWQQNFLPTAAVNTVWGTSAMRGVTGRRVRIEKLDQSPNFITFAEFEVWGSAQDIPVNLASGKPVNASAPGFGTLAANGNDGKLDGNYTLPGNPIYHSAAAGAGQFWEVDLGQDRQLDYATIFNRTDHATTTSVRLSVRNSAGTEVYSTTLGDISLNVAVNGGVQFDVTHDFPGVVTGRFVRLETTLAQFLAFTEFEVFGPVADTLAPTLSATDPTAGTLLAELFQTEVTFSETVAGVNAADLLVNGVAATSVTQLTPERYAFGFPQPANGPVNFTWAAAHGITDMAGNPFAGAGWSVTLNTALPAPRPVISEFMADNAGGLRDEDGASSDWIELYNPGPTAANLNGWYLTDSATTLAKWRIPTLNMAAGSRVIVFASGKDRAVAGAELHTSFKLKKESGYLALVKPDQMTIASAWTYGAQKQNASFGTGALLGGTPLITAGSAVKWLVPGGSVAGWEGAAFKDAAWATGTAGLGFDQNTGGGGLLGFWNFNDASSATSAADASGNGRTGTLTTATYTANAGGRTGVSGDRAMTFGGTGFMGVAAAGTGAFDSSTTNNAISLSLWVNGDAALQPSGDFIFFAGANADGSGSRRLGGHLPWSNSVIYWDTTDCCDPALHRVFVGEPDPSRWEGQWNHYVFIKNGDTKEIWQNGAMLHSGQNTADFAPFRSLFLGSAPGGTSGYHGLVDDFAVWDSALSPGEIAAISAGGSPLAARRLTPHIATNVGAQMRNVNASIYARLQFTVATPAGLDVLLLRMRYDDGFVAYLNGVEIARRNSPATPVFNSASASVRASGAALTQEQIDISAYAPLLNAGDNVLAIHGMNSSAADGAFLLQPELIAGSSLGGRYFTSPSPGAANDSGFSGFTGDTSFSVKRGFYDTPQTVSITCITPGATIAYTTDGTDPSPTNGTLSASPAVITVNTTTILRATAFAADLAPSNIDTHSYIFPDAVASQMRPASLGATWPSGDPTDFEMDGRVYSGAQPGYTVRDGLLSIPSLSVTVAPDGLWGAANGIYSQSAGRGSSYERVASAEYLVPGQPLAGFHARFGMRMHGNISRNKNFTPKHSFKMFFRGDYGDARLNYDLFGSGVDKFDQLILRAGSTDTWACVEWGQVGIGPGGAPAYRWLRPWSSFVRDEWVRTTFLDMKQPSPRGRFVHLYLNGLYWGVYNIAEHPDDDFCADTIGGDADHWDTLKDFAELESGDFTAWNQLISFASAGLATDAQYQRLLGRNADGTPNPAYNVLLNEDSLIDYMLLHIFIGADDWPEHNWWAGRKSRGTTPGNGFYFFPWDQEISNENHTYERSSWGHVYQNANAANTPTQVYFAARSNAEFRRRFADRIQRHMFNGGALSQTANVARWASLTGQIDKAVVAESARWGDHRRPEQPYTREADWLTHTAYMNNMYWPNINTAVLGRLTNAGLWPATLAPAFSPFGGAVPITHTLSISNPNGSGTLLYTLDCTDPRAFGGGIAAGAVTYSGSIAVNTPRTVKARVRTTTGEWSPMAEAAFTIIVDSDADGLGDAWELANGYSLSANESAQDTDGDDHNNLLEYRAGTDPRSPGSLLGFSAITRVGDTVTLTFTARANRAYTLQKSTDLVAWTVAGTHAAEAADHTAIFIDPAATGSKNFYRLAPSVP